MCLIFGLPFTIIVFFTDPCPENEVRLNDNVVEVCHNAQWGLVCVHFESWHASATLVVCRQVGIPSKSQFMVLLVRVTVLYKIMCYYTDPRALRRDIIRYSDSPVILNDIDCSGSEDRLTQCTKTGYGNFSSNCTDIAVALCEGGNLLFFNCIATL